MEILYDKDNYCMNFSNEEIEKYLLNPLREKTEIVVKLSSGEKKSYYTGKEKIKCIFFDGDKEKFNVSFYGHQTSIFISDESSMPNRTFTFNEEFMFIDDGVKENITLSHTFGNIVYEGTLRDKSHKEILGLLYDFIILLIGAKKITVDETIVSEVGWQYPKCSFIVKVTNNTLIKSKVKFDNIIFSMNEINH